MFFFFSPTNVLLGMSTICRKHCHMGKGGGGSHFKSDCTYFKKKKKCILSIGLTPLPCFLNSHRSRGAMHSDTHVGNMLCENSAEMPKRKGAEVAVKEKSCYFYFPMSIGRETEMGKCIYTTQLLILLIYPSEQLRVHGGLLVRPKASSL